MDRRWLNNSCHRNLDRKATALDERAAAVDAKAEAAEAAGREAAEKIKQADERLKALAHMTHEEARREILRQANTELRDDDIIKFSISMDEMDINNPVKRTHII